MAGMIEFKPRPSQVIAIKHLLRKAYAGLFMDPGLGKTAVTLHAFDVLKKKKFVNRLLVVAPLRAAYQVWPAEVKKWGFDYKVVILHGPKKAEAFKEDADVYVINYDGLAWLSQRIKGWKYRPEMLVFDESTKMRNTRTKRFKIVKPLLPLFKRRVILTGTPTPRSLMNIFGQIYLLDLGASLGKYITHFRMKYFYPSGYGGYDWQLAPGSEEKIYQKVAPLVLRFSDEELGLEPPIHVNRYVELPTAARRTYGELEEHLITQMRDGSVSLAKNAGVLTIKLRQVANGGLYVGDDEGHRHATRLHLEKAVAIQDLVEEQEGEPVLVAYEFHHDLERLLYVLGKDTPYVGQGVSAKVGDQYFSQLNAGELPVLLVQMASVAHGLNLQSACHTIAFHSMTYDFEVYEQLWRRLHRGGQTRQVVIHHVLAKDTVDEHILTGSLQPKKARQDRFFKALEDDLRRRLGARHPAVRKR